MASKRQLIGEVIGDERSLLRSFQRSRAGARGFGHDLDRAGRGALDEVYAQHRAAKAAVR
jgi:hypothetical protein